MKLLKRICLLQFFLYERQDLEVDGHTAFLGPNGTGKTCLLDAIQTVMLGADAGKVHYNAQADGKRKDRSLRSYCLGVQDQSGHGCRPQASTYIALVFEDQMTGERVSAGVSLSAREDSPQHTVNGLFILPGVDLTTAELVETRDGAERVIGWRDIQPRFKELVQAAGAVKSAVITQNREEFVRKLLLDHLAAPGDNPNPDMFRNAFQRAMQLKVSDDLSAALRDNLIEPRPTHIREFKARVDEFKRLTDLVHRTENQIAQLGLARERFNALMRYRRTEVNYTALAATLEVEQHASRMHEAEDKLEDLRTAVQDAISKSEMAAAAKRQAASAEAAARDARAQSSEYQALRTTSEEVTAAESAVADARTSLELDLRAMQSGLAGVGRHPDMAEQVKLFEAAMTVVTSVMTTVTNGHVPDGPTIEALAKAVSQAASASARQQRHIQHAHEDLVQERQQAREAAERAAKGLSPLATPVRVLRDALREAGIDASPVCDVTEVAQPRWQPAIESYLGMNAQALVISREAEEDAIDIARRLGGRARGAKLVLPSRVHPWRGTAPGLLAGELIKGDDLDAVNFIRQTLGQLACVDTVAELRASKAAIMEDGTLSKGMTIEPLGVPERLVIGRQGDDTSRTEAERKLRAIEQRIVESKRRLDLFNHTLDTLTPFGLEPLLAQRVNRLVSAWHGTQAKLRLARDQQRAAMSGDLLVLEQAHQEAAKALEEAEEQDRHWLKRQGTLEALAEQVEQSLDGLRSAVETSRLREQELRKDSLYDANRVNTYRERIEGTEELAPDTFPIAIGRCHAAAKDARGKAESQQGEAVAQLERYRIEFGVNADIPSEWQGKAHFVEGEHERLSTLTLAERVKDAEDALKAAEQVFRTDVVQALRSGFARVEAQVDALNKVLQKAPLFSNRERYRFKKQPVDQHKSLYDFLTSPDAMHTDAPVWSESTSVPKEFRDLMESDASTPLLADTSPLYDYRRFFSYDVEILRDGEKIGVLSKRFGPGSGGEHRTPLYVIYGAALAAAYGNIHGRNAGGGLMLLDEAFDKMDATNVVAVAGYLEKLGLQLLMAGPETDQPKLSGFLHMYYDMARHGTNYIHMEPYRISAAARELLASDNPLLHPDLVQQQLELMRVGTSPASGATP